jgi:hypothetical protein
MISLGHSSCASLAIRIMKKPTDLGRCIVSVSYTDLACGISNTSCSSPKDLLPVFNTSISIIEIMDTEMI